jgi:spore coat protein U-like protein
MNTTTPRTNTRLRAIRSTAAAAALTALLLTGAAAPSHAATGHTVNVTIGGGVCPAGGTVKAIQFGSADALTSVPKKTGNNASIKIKTGTRYITFTGVAWCKTAWWRPLTPSYFSKRVYVKATQNTIHL